MSHSPTKQDKLAAPPVLLFLAVAVALAALPLFGQTSSLALILLGAMALVRGLNLLQLRGLAATALKLAVLGFGVGGIYLQYGGITGMEAGLGILVVLVALKFMEAHTRRDVQVVALLGFFLLLCTLFFSQDLARWIYVTAMVGMISTGLVYQQTFGAPRALRSAARIGFRLTLQAIPLIVLMFFFFPRVYGGFRFQFGRSTQGMAGMDDRMEPGSMASLAQRTDIAFRADFPDGKAPVASEMYWRGLVLWRGDGLTWVRSYGLSSERRANSLGGDRIRQRIFLAPHGGRWLFALDRPASLISKSTLEPGGYLQSVRPIYYPLSYEVYSRPENQETSLPADQRQEALRRPQHVSPRVQALVDGWRAKSEDTQEIIRMALTYFQKNNFSYTLSPGTYGGNALEEFLFQKRVGFCEHYAGAFATLMRLAGIPSRVVIGYHGGQFNPHGNYYRVRQADAHAWCEVWFANKGWQRVDPTSVIAPDRISVGLDNFLDLQVSAGRDASSQANTESFWGSSYRDARLIWDSLAYRWDSMVLNFDEDSQRSFLLTLGLGAWDWSWIAVLLVAGIAIVLSIWSAWFRFTGRTIPDPVQSAFARFVKLLSQFVQGRETTEGPLRFTQRAAEELPELASDIHSVGNLYVRSRYGKHPAPVAELRSAITALELRIKREKRK